MWAGRTYRVQVPEARGKVIPEIASISEDFPALCDPRTAMTGMSRSKCALEKKTLRWAAIDNRLTVSLTLSREGDSQHQASCAFQRYSVGLKGPPGHLCGRFLG